MNGEAMGYTANLQRGILLRGQRRYKHSANRLFLFCTNVDLCHVSLFP